MVNDYFIYKNEVGEIGYASMSFYEDREGLRGGLSIMAEDLSETKAKRLCGVVGASDSG